MIGSFLLGASSGLSVGAAETGVPLHRRACADALYIRSVIHADGSADHALVSFTAGSFRGRHLNECRFRPGSVMSDPTAVHTPSCRRRSASTTMLRATRTVVDADLRRHDGVGAVRVSPIARAGFTASAAAWSPRQDRTIRRQTGQCCLAPAQSPSRGRTRPRHRCRRRCRDRS